MAKTLRKTKVVGNVGRRAFGSRPKKYRSSKPKRRPAHRSNAAEILGFTLAGNPGRRKGNMAKSNPRKHKKHHHRHRNPFAKRNPGMKVNHHRRRRNPGLDGGIGALVTNAAFVIIGAVGTKLATQAVLGTNNTGVIGYAGNAVAGGILWWITEKFMHNKEAAKGIISGTVVQILLRVINDYTPFGQYVSSLGMGDYQMQSFVTPQVLVDPWNSAAIQLPPGWGPGPAQAAAAAVAANPAKALTGGGGMSGIYGAGGGWGTGLY